LKATQTRYSDARAHALRAEYLATYPVPEIPVPVESIAEDLLGLRIEERDLGDCSGMLIPAERLIVVNAAESMSGDTPIRRHRFTIAHELGHCCGLWHVEDAGNLMRPAADSEAMTRAQQAVFRNSRHVTRR